MKRITYSRTDECTDGYSVHIDCMSEDKMRCAVRKLYNHFGISNTGAAVLVTYPQQRVKEILSVLGTAIIGTQPTDQSTVANQPKAVRRLIEMTAG